MTRHTLFGRIQQMYWRGPVNLPIVTPFINAKWTLFWKIYLLEKYICCSFLYIPIFWVSETEATESADSPVFAIRTRRLPLAGQPRSLIARGSQDYPERPPVDDNEVVGGYGPGRLVHRDTHIRAMHAKSPFVLVSVLISCTSGIFITLMNWRCCTAARTVISRRSRPREKLHSVVCFGSQYAAAGTVDSRSLDASSWRWF